MNRIVREHYPVSKLPEDLRQGLDGWREVRVSIETHGDNEGLSPQIAANVETRPFSRLKPVAGTGFKSMEEVVAHVRALRDEWDEREELHERLRNGS